MPAEGTGRGLLTRAWFALPRSVRDAAPILAVVPGAFAPPNDLLVNGGGPQWPTVPTVLLTVAAGLLVGLRLRHPRGAAAAVIAASVAAMAAGGSLFSYLAALMIVVFSVARHTDRRTAVIVAAVAAATVGVTGTALLPEEWGTVRPFVQVSAMVGFAAAAGDASRSRRAFIDTITERARRAEETKESEARRRVAEERLAIARDLHDVVAHQIAVINLHAGVASSALRARPDDAERSLGTIREAARTVLGEIGGLLNVLRTSDPPAGPAAGLAPAPGLAELDRLVTDFARGGLRVDVRTVGTPYQLPESVDLVAYRVIQEGLTNAQKHGSDASALLQVEYDPALLDVTVTNTVAAKPRASRSQTPGHGLTGARERVAAVHGTLDTSFGPGPVHRLTARLPLPGPMIDSIP